MMAEISNHIGFTLSFRQCYVLFLFISAYNITHVIAQQDSSKSFSVIIAGDAESAIHDAGEIITAPLHFSDQDWLNSAFVLGGTALSFTTDHSVRSFMQRQQSIVGDDLANVGGQYGSGLNAVLFSGGLYTVGLLAKNNSLRTTGVMTFESVAIAGGLCLTLKFLTGRSRPYAEEGSFKFRGLQTDDAHVSFPSGHTTVAFALSSVLAGRMHNTAISIALYSLATLTAVSRIYEDEHWFSDTVLGAAIGTTVGLTVVHLHSSDDNKETSFRLVPKVQGIGVALAF